MMNCKMVSFGGRKSFPCYALLYCNSYFLTKSVRKCKRPLVGLQVKSASKSVAC